MYQSAAIAAAAAWLACFAAWSFEIKGGTFSHYAAGVRVRLARGPGNCST